MNDPLDGPVPMPEPDPCDQRHDAEAGPPPTQGQASGGAPDEVEQEWDSTDPRRRHDQMAPPTVACECYCIHCGRTFMSDRIWFQKVIGSRDGFDGFWMCPTPNCGGAGFTFDIFPTDPAHPANAGWHYSDDDGSDPEGEDGEWDDQSSDLLLPTEESSLPDKDYDPDEPSYKSLDDLYGGDGDSDDDLEGEEWKYGLQPGERPNPSDSDEGRRAWEDEQRKYDQPDERPRELDWTNREEEERPGKPFGDFRDDDIPF